jgi:putative sigma-54 modulation protein
LNYNVRGENIEVTPALREYVEKKIGKLERYFEDSIDANVNVNLKFYNDQESKIEVTIPMTNLVLRAEEYNEDMYAAIDLVTNKLERQIRKHKTKVNRKLREQGSAKFMFTNGAVEAEGEHVQPPVQEEDDSIEVVRTKRFNLKPMDSEEAILQMNMLGHNFFVFTNAETNSTNVVYQRKDGKYAIIEPTE